MLRFHNQPQQLNKHKGFHVAVPAGRANRNNKGDYKVPLLRLRVAVRAMTGVPGTRFMVNGVSVTDGSTVDLVLDVLETHFGEWFTVRDLMFEVRRYRPGLARDTVYRAIRRVADSGLVERRIGGRVPQGGSRLLMLRASGRWYL